MPPVLVAIPNYGALAIIKEKVIEMNNPRQASGYQVMIKK